MTSKAVVGPDYQTPEIRWGCVILPLNSDLSLESYSTAIAVLQLLLITFHLAYSTVFRVMFDFNLG